MIPLFLSEVFELGLCKCRECYDLCVKAKALQYSTVFIFSEFFVAFIMINEIYLHPMVMMKNLTGLPRSHS